MHSKEHNGCNPGKVQEPGREHDKVVAPGVGQFSSAGIGGLGIGEECQKAEPNRDVKTPKDWASEKLVVVARY